MHIWTIIYELRNATKDRRTYKGRCFRSVWFEVYIFCWLVIETISYKIAMSVALRSGCLDSQANIKLHYPHMSEKTCIFNHLTVTGYYLLHGESIPKKYASFFMSPLIKTTEDNNIKLYINWNVFNVQQWTYNVKQAWIKALTFIKIFPLKITEITEVILTYIY